ncbi:MAG: Gfo/Idh/MocA family oxidoreductase [Rhodospirillales bacterium]|nr:Gfo/Idh/MocA family oxidoreductase [Rhodospirillales bacterium]
MKRKVAVVGLGIGRAHIDEGYSKLPAQWEVAAICDLDAARLAEVGDAFGIARRTSSFADVLGMTDIDVVDICTPPSLHREQLLAAMASGKHVIGEKPFVTSLAEMDAIEAAAAAARGTVMPIFQYRWGDGFRRALRVVRAGLAGKPYTATVETAWRRDKDYYDIAWHGTWAIERGGCLLGHAIHSHDMMQELMGDALSVYAHVATRVNPIETEDCAAATLRMASGAVVALAATLGSASEISRMRLHFENVTFESSTEPYAPGNEPWQILPRNAAAKEAIGALLADHASYPIRFEGQLRAYGEALDAGEGPPVTLRDARRSLELITALYGSVASGVPQALPMAPTHRGYRDWRPGAQP